MIEDVTSQRERLLRLRAKQELRRRMRRLRRVVPPEAREARARRVVARVLDLPAYQRARTVVGYLAIRDELDPAEILSAAAGDGKRVGLPRIEGDGVLSLRVHEDGAPLVENDLGIAEPDASAPALPVDEVDLILVPALVVDARGHRIGYGRGFYDRLLPTLSNAHTVAVAFDFQLLAELPDTVEDVSVHTVVTDERTLTP